MIRSLCLLLGVTSILTAEPRAPFVMPLNQYAIHEVPISTASDTSLLFPDDVPLVLGKPLTDGKQPGQVYCQQAQNAKHIVLRQLEEGSEVLMQTTVNGKVYVFRLVGSTQPATVIYCTLAGHTPPAVEIASANVQKTKRSVSEERVGELIRLTKEAAFLKPLLPHEYEGFSSRRVSMSSELENGLSTEITGVGKFRREDTLIIFGSIQNGGKKTAQLMEQNFRLQIGEGRICPLSRIEFSESALKPNVKCNFTATLIGDGDGNPGRIHIENRFALSLQDTPNKNHDLLPH